MELMYNINRENLTFFLIFIRRGDFMEKFSIKTKLIILILLICGFILLIDNYTYAGCNKGCKNFDLIAYQRVLIINGNNETKYKVRDGVVKIPFVNKTGSGVVWSTSNSKIAIVNQYRICNRNKSRKCYNYC